MVWDTIPPKKPERFSVYIGKLTRNLSISKLRKNNALKRSTKSDVVWDEIEDLIPDPVADLADTVILKEAINRFLRELSKKDRMIFVKRYWYMSPSKDIAKDLGVIDSYVRLKLFRLRNDFKEFLSREGIDV
jgi:RNA polymerase sigma-70 factor (ECF subfamily)